MLFCVSEFLQFVYQLIRKESTIFSLIGFFVLALVAGGENSIYSVDYDTYLMVYNNKLLRQSYFENGFNRIQDLFYKNNFTYETFRLVIVLVAMFFLFLGIRRFTKNVSFFVALYGSIFFLNDANQLRNLLMLSIGIFGISFLIDPSVKNFFIATIIVFVSAQLQSLGYIFLLIILLRLFSKKIIKKSGSIVSIFTLGLFLLSSSGVLKDVMNFLTNLLQGISTRGNLFEKINGQYTYGSNKVGFLIVVVEVFLSFYCETKLLNVKQKFHDETEFHDYENKTIILYLGNVVSLMTLPLMFLAFDYARIQHNMGILLIINMALFFEQNLGASKEKFKLEVLFSLTMICYGINNYLLWGSYFIQTIPQLIGL